MCKWIIAVTAAALLVVGCGGGAVVGARAARTAAAVETIKGAYDYEFENHEGRIRLKDRTVYVGWRYGRPIAVEILDDGKHGALTRSESLAYWTAFEVIEADLAARFEALKK
jgi:hypothetical protein